MKINNTIISTILVLGLSFLTSPAYAEEVVEEPLAVEEPAPAPEPEPEYVPPAEAHEGVGGWAVVDPRTGKVHGVIVGSMKTYESRNGLIGHEYMGCAADCVLRFQTRATADGNVAGYSSSGNAEVKFNSSDKTFSITDNGPDGSKSVSVLVPEKTAKDPAGMDLSTGIVSRNTTKKNEQVDIKIAESYIDANGNEVRIEYLTWGVDKKLFSYINGQEALGSLESDVDDQLLLDFPALERRVEITEIIDELTEEVIVEETIIEETVIDEENSFVKTIRSITESVVSFFTSLFGG